MRPSSTPPLIEREFERARLIAGLHAMREWPLADLFDYIDAQSSERARLLAGITVAECLRPDTDRILQVEDLRTLAERSRGATFELLVLSVLLEVFPLAVKRAYLMRRLGGPRWKLQAAMQSLAAEGKVSMFGQTSARRYLAQLPREEAR